MSNEYLRRDLEICKAVGIQAGAATALKRLANMKRPPAWVIKAFAGISERAEGLPAELAAWRNQADDAPDYVFLKSAKGKP